MTNRDNKAAAAEFSELFGIDFDEFTRQAPVKILLALAKFASRSISPSYNSPARRTRCTRSNASD